jgi:pyruvate,water dikinase
MSEITYVKWFEDLRSKDVASVGGKNSSLGEMTSQLRKYNIPVPPGFATTSQAYFENIKASGSEFIIKSEIKLLDEGKKTLADVGRAIRKAVSSSPLSPELEAAILDSYHELCDRCGENDLSVAVRSSATAEDLPEASFAGVSIELHVLFNYHCIFHTWLILSYLFFL